MDTASPIRAALYRGDEGEARRLAAEAPALDVFDAAALGDVERVQALVRTDRSLAQAYSDDGFTALHFAAFLGGPAAARELLDAGADVRAVSRNDMRVQPLHSAVARKDVETCELLLNAGADPNARQEGDWTPLKVAEHEGHQALAGLLRSHGATV